MVVEREAKCLGWRYLCDQADIRNGWPVAVAKDPARLFSASSASIACKPAPSQCWIQASLCCWITDTWNWHWVFYVNLLPGIAVTILAFVIARLLVPLLCNVAASPASTSASQCQLKGLWA
jgi:MFS family permease